MAVRNPAKLYIKSVVANGGYAPISVAPVAVLT